MGLNPTDGPDFVSVYIDDVLVFSQSLADHIKHLELVIARLIQAGLKLRPGKCRFIRQEVEYLGHVITPAGLLTSARHVAAVREFSTPTSVTEVRRFLGLASYYRRFIPSFAKLAQPGHSLHSLAWTEACETAFGVLKQKLREAPVLAFPAFDRGFILETDASIQGIGAVLSQTQDDGTRHPIAFASRALSPAERNYGITELETLAVVWAVSHFRTYLYGQEVVVYTDHSSVRAVLQNPNASGKHARWWAKVHGSGIKKVDIVYRPGKENLSADALSRSPSSQTEGEELESDVQVWGIMEEVTDIPHLLQLTPERGSVSDHEVFAREQLKDTRIAEMLHYLQTEALPEDEKCARKVCARADLFTVQDGVLYYIDVKQESRRRAIVPSHLRSAVMEQVHRGLNGGHFSGRRLYNVLVRSWWWEGMYSDAVKHCQNCPERAVMSGHGKPGRFLCSELFKCGGSTLWTSQGQIGVTSMSWSYRIS